MIDEHLDEIEKIIKDDHLVIFSDFQRICTSQNTAYIKAKIMFIDNSFLSIFHHVHDENGLFSFDYRYHYMDSKNTMIFRYDNAPHHPEVQSFPHHKAYHGRNKRIRNAKYQRYSFGNSPSYY